MKTLEGMDISISLVTIGKIKSEYISLSLLQRTLMQYIYTMRKEEGPTSFDG